MRGERRREEKRKGMEDKQLEGKGEWERTNYERKIVKVGKYVRKKERTGDLVVEWYSPAERKVHIIN